MAAVYKTISKSQSRGHDPPEEKKVNRQRVLLLSSRGVTFRQRHLLNDIHSLLPHSRKENKLDTKTKLYQLNELADLYNCNNVFFFEARKGQDLYAWMSKAPNGPTIRMHVQNLHTMDELNFTGNCLKGSRPILSFDSAFDDQPHLRLIKELLSHIFDVPKSSRKLKPFVDHVLGFTLAQGRIWVRCYQINEQQQQQQSQSQSQSKTTEQPATANGVNHKNNPTESESTDVSLIEIGPRFVLTPIVILEGSFGGPVIYENKEYVSPNQVRSELRRAKAGRFNSRAEASTERRAKRGDLGLSTGGRKRERDALDEKVLFA